MKTESKRRNGAEHVPACSTWPPPWLISSTLAALTPRIAQPKLPVPTPAASPWELPPDLYERWEERVCIMHYDGKLPWREAEALALADVLRQADAMARLNRKAGPRVEPGDAAEPAAAVQAELFATEANAGPYSWRL
jgi:hypothetical protein